jgi:hypothetical protein
LSKALGYMASDKGEALALVGGAEGDVSNAIALIANISLTAHCTHGAKSIFRRLHLFPTASSIVSLKQSRYG